MITKKHLLTALILGVGVVITASTLQVSATQVTIDVNLAVTPNIISFETVFPGEVYFRPLGINLSNDFINNAIKDDVEYKILQRPKPHINSSEERAYCADNPTDYERCYPSLCPYLSKEADNKPENDTSVPAYHDPWATSSIAYGRLAKSDNDTEDNWIIDLHTPCFKGECDQTKSIPLEYQLDPSLRGEKFGCDLIVEVTNISYFSVITRTIGFWKTHTNFTSNIFSSKLGGTMTVGTSTHIRTITNLSGNQNSILFGAYYSSIPKKTNNQNRNSTDKARMKLLRQLVTAKLNCAAFGCTPQVQTLLANADSAYATGSTSQINSYANQIDTYNNSGDGNAIPPELGNPGSATPSQSQTRANKVFWNTP